MNGDDRALLQDLRRLLERHREPAADDRQAARASSEERLRSLVDEHGKQKEADGWYDRLTVLAVGAAVVSARSFDAASILGALALAALLTRVLKAHHVSTRPAFARIERDVPSAAAALNRLTGGGLEALAPHLPRLLHLAVMLWEPAVLVLGSTALAFSMAHGSPFVLLLPPLMQLRGSWVRGAGQADDLWAFASAATLFFFGFGFFGEIAVVLARLLVGETTTTAAVVELLATWLQMATFVLPFVAFFDHAVEVAFLVLQVPSAAADVVRRTRLLGALSRASSFWVLGLAGDATTVIITFGLALIEANGYAAADANLVFWLIPVFLVLREVGLLARPRRVSRRWNALGLALGEALCGYLLLNFLATRESNPKLYSPEGVYVAEDLGPFKQTFHEHHAAFVRWMQKRGWWPA